MNYYRIVEEQPPIEYYSVAWRTYRIYKRHTALFGLIKYWKLLDPTWYGSIEHALTFVKIIDMGNMIVYNGNSREILYHRNVVLLP